MARAWKWLACLAVAASPWLIGLGHPFLYDDIGMIAENEFLAEPANWTQAATGRTLLDPQVVNGRRPAVLATFFLDRAWHGLQPAGWRMTSLLLHLGCAGLWMLLLRRLGTGNFVIAGAGLLFAFHPAGVEAVHAPGFRADVLCLLFMLAALHAFGSAGRRPVAGGMAGAVFTALALLSKETALALPLLVAVLPGLFPQAFPTGRRAAGAVAVCAAVAAVFFALWAFLPADLQALGGSWNGESLRFPDNLYSLPAVWARTVRYLLAPWPLNVTPGFEPVRSMASWRFWGGAVLAAGWGWAAWRLRRTRPWLSFGLIWAAALFLPVSNLIPLLHPVADRYLYPMTPGIAVAAAWGLSRCPRPARGAVLALLAALCAGLVAVRIGEWESGERTRPAIPRKYITFTPPLPARFMPRRTGAATTLRMSLPAPFILRWRGPMRLICRSAPMGRRPRR